MTAESARYPSELLRQIDSMSSLEDVRTICFELGVDHENIPAATKEGLIRELIKQLVRQDRLPELIVLLRVKLPTVDWQDVPPDLALIRDDPFNETAVQRLDFEPETASIPAGPFLMGSDSGNAEEAPRHKVELPAFAIGCYPVTNGQYARFIWDSGGVAGSALLWDGNRPPDGRFNYPVSGVTWYEALEYCRWLAKATGRRYSLPSEAQWEKAARGADGRLFPWGDEWVAERCNTSADDLTPVNAYPPQSVYGCSDMIGNAREWTLTAWGREPKTPDPLFRYPWKDDHRNNPGEPSTTRRVFRGGRATNPNVYRCSARGSFLPDKPGPSGNRHGFRVVLSAT